MMNIELFLKKQNILVNYFKIIASKKMAWAKFERYIVGRPNLIFLPIQVKLGYTNAFLNKGCDFKKGIDGVW